MRLIFEGTPIPTTFLLTAVLGWAAWQDRLASTSTGAPGPPPGLATYTCVPTVCPLRQLDGQQDAANT